jgi:hypothetical protein
MDARLRQRVRQRAAGRCEYCGVREGLEPLAFHVEHITARQHEGKDTEENLALACQHCNLHKGSNLSALDPQTGDLTRLFHPRRRKVHRERFSAFAPANSWALIVTPYVLEEVVRNLPQLPLSASMDWPRLRHDLQVKDDVLTLALPAVFPVTKDRPVFFSTLAWAGALLTLDRADFARVLENAFYSLPILRPGAFLVAERAAGKLKPN